MVTLVAWSDMGTTTVTSLFLFASPGKGIPRPVSAPVSIPVIPPLNSVVASVPVAIPGGSVATIVPQPVPVPCYTALRNVEVHDSLDNLLVILAEFSFKTSSSSPPPPGDKK